jgi:hypothetical protein
MGRTGKGPWSDAEEQALRDGARARAPRRCGASGAQRQ